MSRNFEAVTESMKSLNRLDRFEVSESPKAGVQIIQSVQSKITV